MPDIHQNISSYHRGVCCVSGRTRSLSPSVWSSLLMAIAGMGDALLYAYLPVKGEALGFSLFTIGLLLSINKFTRFFTNRWVAYISDRWRIKNVLLFGVVLAALTTFTYALDPAIWIWIVARLIWGAAYSALRFSTIQYAGISHRVGSALGIGRSIQDAGPLLAYWIGPVMLAWIGAEATFSSWALLLVMLLPVFYLLPDIQHETQEIKPFSFQKPQWIDVWVFISSFTVEGLVVVGISRLVNLGDTGHLLLVSALYISLRRLLNVMISPASGWLSDTFGMERVFHYSCMLITGGTLLIALRIGEAGIMLAFMGSSVNLTLVPIVAIQLNPSNKSFEALTRMNTSRDMGSAFGALLGLSLLNTVDIQVIFMLLSLVLISLWFKIRKLDKRDA